ncbi:hypothetical protein C2S51_024326 [Perilla frutescens var. frutescens]|nr:hypothetical protein C2S51_024326 [Perilla frutescens var. frutescens]
MAFPPARRTFPPLCGISHAHDQETMRRRLHGTIPRLWLQSIAFQQTAADEVVAPTPRPAPMPPERDDDDDDEDLIEIDDADVEDLMSATEIDDADDDFFNLVDDLLISTEIDEYLIADDGVPEEVVSRCMKTMTCEEVAAAGGGETCAVCQDDMCREDRTNVGVLRCQHRFHADCIGKWLQMKNFCPLCKAVALEFM